MKKVILSLFCFSMALVVTGCSSSQSETSQTSSEALSNASSETVSVASSESSAQSIGSKDLTASFSKGDAVIESSYGFNDDGSVKSVELRMDFPSANEANDVYTKLNDYQDIFSSAEVNDKSIYIDLNEETLQATFGTQTKDTITEMVQSQGGQIQS